MEYERSYVNDICSDMNKENKCYDSFEIDLKL